ncbi:NifU family protein [Streptomyces sp. NPDC018045]|uniref:NifU family protein n=1 Tax=Streptomyces sp. NPDC018045 TaxID=3365037 RepID=UPI0037B62040
MEELRQTEARVEELIGRLATSPRVGEQVEELVRLLMRLYGGGLARITELLPAERVAELAADDLVGSLLILHDLHPRGTAERVTEALARVRPFLGSHGGDVELVGIDGAGVARIRLHGACDGCASSAATVEQAVTRAVRSVAPEVTGVRVESAAPRQPLLQIGSGPPPRCPAPTGRGART